MRMTLVRVGLTMLLALGPADGAAAKRTTVDPAEIRDAIETAWVARGSTTELEIRALPALSYAGDGALLEVLLPEEISRPGPRALPVQCRVEGRVVARGLASVIVRRTVTVWVPVRPLTRGETVTTQDLRPEPRLFDRTPARLFEGPGESTWTAAANVEAGHVLRATHLRREPDVRSGDPITLISRHGDAAVRIAGRARRAGNVGEQILVLNPITGAVVRAVLLDAGSALLVTPETRAEGSTR